MTTQEAIRSRILALCQEYELTPNGLSLQSCITQSTINSILHGESRATKVITIKKICDGLGISLAEFFDADQFKDLDQEL